MYFPINNTFCGDTIESQKLVAPRAVTHNEYRELARKEFTTPQPHFKPGYTGYIPGTMYDMIGQTYGCYAHRLLNDHRVGGNRLTRIPEDYYVQMHVPVVNDVDNPHKTLEPHFIPGYTGFIPGSGIKRSEGFGETYGRMTHVKLANHFLKGSRLRPILGYPEECVAREEDTKFYNYEHELVRDDLKRKTKMVPGYTGHMPRARFRFGKSGTQTAEECIAEFQQILNKNRIAS